MPPALACLLGVDGALEAEARVRPEAIGRRRPGGGRAKVDVAVPGAETQRQASIELVLVGGVVRGIHDADDAQRVAGACEDQRGRVEWVEVP